MYDNVTLRFRCDEPKGRVNRTVRRLEPETSSVLWVYDQLAVCTKQLFGAQSVESIEHLIKDYWKYWLVDDVGVLCFSPCGSGWAHVHVTFWDKRLRGREELCRELARCLMRRYEVHSLITSIPLESRAIAAFVRRVGFVPQQVIVDRQLYTANAGCFTAKHQEV